MELIFVFIPILILMGVLVLAPVFTILAGTILGIYMVLHEAFKVLRRK